MPEPKPTPKFQVGQRVYLNAMQRAGYYDIARVGRKYCYLDVSGWLGEEGFDLVTGVSKDTRGRYLQTEEEHEAQVAHVQARQRLEDLGFMGSAVWAMPTEMMIQVADLTEPVLKKQKP